MKNLFNQIFTSILTIGFVFALNLIAVAQESPKPPYLPKIKESTEVKDLAKFAESLAEFYLISDAIARINTSKGTTDPSKDLLDKLAAAAKKVKDGATGFGKNVDGLIPKLPSSKDDPGREKLEEEIEQLLGSRSVRSFFKRHTGKQVLSFVAVPNRGSQRIISDTANIINDPPKLGFYKPKFPCAVLATAVLAAELRKATKTASTVDSFFKAVCDATGSLNQ